jgi:hypothetical protein
MMLRKYSGLSAVPPSYFRAQENRKAGIVSCKYCQFLNSKKKEYGLGPQNLIK